MKTVKLQPEEFNSDRLKAIVEMKSKSEAFKEHIKRKYSGGTESKEELCRQFILGEKDWNKIMESK